jgi:hypothetical protein
VRSSAQIVVTGDRRAIRNSITTVPAASAIADKKARTATGQDEAGCRCGGSGNNSGSGAQAVG